MATLYLSEIFDIKYDIHYMTKRYTSQYVKYTQELTMVIKRFDNLSVVQQKCRGYLEGKGNLIFSALICAVRVAVISAP